MKPEPLLREPPKISTFRLHSSKSHRDAAAGGVATRAIVACANKSLLVLYGGRYTGPGSSPCGCYLVYDFAASSGAGGSLTLRATVVPTLPVEQFLKSMGPGAVALRRHPRSSSYILSELAFTRFPDAELYLWRSDSQTPQWEKKAVRLPDEVCLWEPGNHSFCIDTSFSFGESSLCWADLVRGLVVCLDPLGQDPQLRVVALPSESDGCARVMRTSDHPDRPRIHEIRTVACVAGVVKLVALEGFLEGWKAHEFRFVTWTLAPDLSGWKKGAAVFHLKDIWESERYLALKIPRRTPVCPVLSPRDDGTVCAVVNDVEVHNVFRGCELLETKVDIKGQYVLRLDVERNTVISIDGGRPAAAFAHLTPSLIPTDFSYWMQGPKDRQREVEASKVGESGKKPKVV